MHLVTIREELRHFLRPGELHGAPGASLVAAADVEGLAVLLVAEAAHRVEVFKREAEWVHDGVATRTRRRLGLERHAVAGGEVRVLLGGNRRERFLRRLDGDAQQSATDEPPAV